MPHKTNYLLLILLAGLSFFCGQAQVISSRIDLSDSTQTHVLETRSGDVLIGRLLEIRDLNVRFQLNTGGALIELPLSEVQAIRVEGERPSRPDKKSSETALYNLTLNPSALPIPAGEAEYRNVGLLYNTVEIGITDQLSYTGGVILPFYVINRLKLGIPLSENVHFGLNGSLFFNFLFLPAGFATFQGSITVGKPDQYLNLSGGYGFLFEDPGRQDRFIASAGGVIRLSDSWSLIADLLLVPESPSVVYPTLLAGYSFNRNRLEFGLVVFPSIGLEVGLPFLPYLSYARRF